MNLQEAKALFFAQYYGQKILAIRNKPEPILYIGFDDLQNNKVKDSDYLLLRSRKSLTIDEALIIAKIYDDSVEWICESDRESSYVFKCTYGTLWVWLDSIEPIFEVEDLTGGCTSYCIDSASQYLRLISILTEFCFLNEENKPITLQPDQIIKLGWAKIK